MHRIANVDYAKTIFALRKVDKTTDIDHDRWMYGRFDADNTRVRWICNANGPQITISRNIGVRTNHSETSHIGKVIVPDCYRLGRFGNIEHFEPGVQGS